jgi:hypothetical protein
MAGEETKKNGEKGKKVTVRGEVLDMMSKTCRSLDGGTEIVHESSSILRRKK